MFYKDNKTLKRTKEIDQRVMSRSSDHFFKDAKITYDTVM